MGASLDLAKKAKQAAIKSRTVTPHQRKQALLQLGQEIQKNQQLILLANEKDLQKATSAGQNRAFLDRLRLTPERLENLSLCCQELAAQNEVLGVLHNHETRPDGLIISRERIPLGVVSMIFESRPNVLVEAAALAIKSGNTIIFKGGREAKESLLTFMQIIEESFRSWLPPQVVQMLDPEDRESVKELLTLKDYVDVLIPRGGEGLINFCQNESKIPVIAHGKGLCHLYIHEDAQVGDTINICENAKVQRPSVCNALETLLIHQNWDAHALELLIQKLQGAKVEIRGSKKLKEIFPHIQLASEEDWSTEYLDTILSIKIVDNEEEAFAHIQKYGQKHTEGICATSKEVIAKFQQVIDASCLVINASTRFNDGGELGLGAEIGISTNKLHAYGPMGAKELTTIRYVVEGKGHVRQ